MPPGPRYRQLAGELSGEIATARATGDAAKLGDCYRQIYDALMTECPANYSPRIGDPKYREAMLARSVHAQVIRELDPKCKAADETYDAIVAADHIVRDAVLAVPEPCPDPDATPAALTAIMRDSIVVQAWTPFLDEQTARELLERTGLREEYEVVDDPSMVSTPCGACGAPRESPVGAGRVVCEKCGMIDELAKKAFCGMCGGAIAFGVGSSSTTCTHCRAVIDSITPL